MGAPPRLMTLRDLLELACDSSCSDGFRSYPRRPALHDDAAAVQRAKAEAAPAHLLIEADLRRSPSRTLSSILFPRSPGSVATVSRLTRSLSRRLVFWRRHRGSDDIGSASDADERDSLDLPSPVVSSCSAAESETDAADLLVPEGNASGSGASDECEKPMPSTSSGCTGSVDDGAGDGDGRNTPATDGDPVGTTTEEKQQLSPVSILDFPFHDDDDDDDDERSDAGTGCSFQQCQPDDLERSNSARELLRHKIRRLDVDPVDLDPRFAASDECGVSRSHSNSSTSTDHDSGPTTLDGPVDLKPRLVASDLSGESDDTQEQSDSSVSTDDSAATASTILSDEQQQSTDDDAESEADAHHHRLYARLLEEGGKQAAASERLLLDFFAEGLDRHRYRLDHDRDESALLRAARQWVQGAGTQWGVEDVLFTGSSALADMDRERRWMCVGEEEGEVGAALGELLMDALLAELVSDLAALRC